MPLLEIKLKVEPGSQLNGVPIAVEVIDSELETLWKGAIPLGQSAKTDNLESGRYSVQVSLPEGRRLSRVLTLTDHDDKVEIEVVNPSPREGLEWAKLSKPEALSSAKGREQHLLSVWVRLWACTQDGRWHVRPWPAQMADRATGVVQYEFNFGNPDSFGQYYLQIGGPTMQWRLVALPADDIRVLITGARATGDLAEMRDEGDSLVEVSVTSKKQDAEILLSHLSQGEIAQANIIADHLLRKKRQNPTAAAIAGYFLLSRGELERVHRVWTNNLSNWMRWLPDGAVINAWYSIRADQTDLKNARRQLLEAAARGVPVYTRGLRLLIDGLALFADDKQHGGPDVSAALKSARRFAAEADWDAPTTTFIGEDPCSPGKRKTGKPDDPQGVVFLTNPDAGDLAWRQQSDWRGATAHRSGGVEITFKKAPTVGRKRRARHRRDPGEEITFNEASTKILYLAEVSDTSMRSLETEEQSEATRSEALGETGLAGDAPASDTPRANAPPEPQASPLPPEVINTYAHFKASREENSAPRSRTLDTDERTIARLFRAADAQTQGEQMQNANPIKLSSDADESPALRGLALERIMGVSELLSVSFLARGLAAARTVGRVGERGADGSPVFYATGFLVSPRLLLTNACVVNNRKQAQSCFVDFDYHDGPDGRLLPMSRIDFDPDTFFITSRELDFTLVALNFPNPGLKFGWNHLSDEQGKILIGECVSVVQHARGEPKQVSLRENQLVGSVEHFLHYQSETAPPSSGAPLYNDQWEVVAMHHAGVPVLNSAGQPLATDGTVWNPAAGTSDLRILVNEGVRVSSIVKFLRDYELLSNAAVLRDELLFLKPPLIR